MHRKKHFGKSQSVRSMNAIVNGDSRDRRESWIYIEVADGRLFMIADRASSDIVCISDVAQ